MAATGVTPINIPYPEASDLHLRVSVGACRLKIQPSSSEAWVTGTHEDPSGTRPLRIVQEAGTVRITEEPSAIGVSGLLSAGFSRWIPTYDLALGKARPYMLTIEAGASENSLDLGGLPISRLAIRHGAGKTDIDFSTPNPQPISLIDLGSGAGSTEIKNLANANFSELLIEGGAASYKLGFGGALRRDAHARITTGMALVEIEVPATTAARVSVETPLGHVEVGDGFTRSAGAYLTQPALENRTPVLIILASVALGTLRLRTV
jgi:hypothetical protein